MFDRMRLMNPSRVLRKILKVFRLAHYPALLLPLRYGVAAGVDHAKILSRLSPVTIVDVGANVGQFSLMAAELHPSARIFSFEPIPRVADRFEKVLAGNPRVTLTRCAIGESQRTDMLHLSGRDDSSSLLPITDLQTSMYPETAEVGQLKVEVKPLDRILTQDDLAKPALLKIDVQGAELEVIKGCASLLRHFDHIYVELSFVEFYSGQPLCHEVIAWLAERNFVLTGVYNLATDKDGVTVQADFLFTRQAKP